MKKINVLSLAMLMSLVLASCGENNTTSEPSSPNTPPVSEENNNSTPSNGNESVPSEENSTPAPVVVHVEAGTKEVAVANPGKYYYEKDENATVSGVVEEGVSKISFSGATAYNSVVFHYEAPNLVTGNRYELTVKIKSGAVMQSATINGKVYQLEKGENEIKFRFTETDDPTLTIVMGDAADADFVTEANELEISTPVVTDVQYAELSTITLDGNLNEWKDTKNEENNLSVIGTGDYEGKGVTFYATLKDEGLYLAAEANHAYFDDSAGAWWQCTNFEFFIGSPAVQGWVSAKADDATRLVTEYNWAKTGDNENGWHSIIEAFVPASNIPNGAIVAGEMRLGLAWKTENDNYRDLCNNGEANGGAEAPYWVPKGTWTDNADMAYVTKDGIYTESQTAFELEDFKTVTLDADLADWEGIQGYTFTGTGDTAHKNVTWYARRTSEGLFVAAKAHHDVFITNGDAWYTSTNLEFWVNGNNQRYISAKGESAGGVYGTFKNVAYADGDAEYETVFEAVIPNAYLEALLGEDDKITIGFAWKTPGDVTTGGGANGGNEDAWWLIPGRSQTDAAQQFVVTENGLTDPLASEE